MIEQLKKLAQLDGRFTESVLIIKGFTTEVIRKAISIGLLKSNSTGILETIPKAFREGRLTTVETNYQVGDTVVKNIGGVATPFVVSAVQGGQYKLTSTDGKNTPASASGNEIALAPLSPEEKAKRLQHASQAAPQTSAPQDNSHTGSPM